MMIIKKTLFFLLFFGPFMLLAQPSVRHLDLLSGDLSIVRNYTDEITISYTQDSPVTGYFVYDDGSGTVLKADMRQNCRVYDFEIYRDTLYFCGRYASGGTVFGFFGFFDISDLFFIGGSMNGTYCYYSNPSSPSEPDLYPTVPWRMDVFEYDGQVHIAAVGECRNWAPYGLQYNTSTSIYDVYFDGSSWNCEAFYIKPYETYFTDIVATDNNVVVTEMAAPENVFNHCQIRIFKQSSAFLNTPLNPSYYTTNVIDGTPVGKVLVDALKNDEFAISNFYYNGTEAGLTVKLFAGSTFYPYSTLFSSIHIPLNTLPVIGSAWELRDIRYNNNVHQLALLLDMDYPIQNITTSTILEYDIYNFGASIIASWLQDKTMFSIDQWFNGFQAVGSEPMLQNPSLTDMFFYKKEFGTKPLCSKIFKPVPYYDNSSSVTLNQDGRDFRLVLPTCNQQYHTPEITEEAIVIDCE